MIGPVMQKKLALRALWSRPAALAEAKNGLVDFTTFIDARNLHRRARTVHSTYASVRVRVAFEYV